MQQVLPDVDPAFAILVSNSRSDTIKASERVLPSIFSVFHKRFGLRNERTKGGFHGLMKPLDPSGIDPEGTRCSTGWLRP
jgi:hypothetical protein